MPQKLKQDIEQRRSVRNSKRRKHSADLKKSERGLKKKQIRQQRRKKQERFLNRPAECTLRKQQR